MECLWEDTVKKQMPKSEEEFRSKILDMEEAWQFPCCWSAVDGCHILIKCQRQPYTTTKILQLPVEHNVCLEKGDTITWEMDLAIDPKTGNRRDRDTVRELLQVRQDT